jgi:hypothetical protein
MQNRVLARATWLAPILLTIPFLTGADGNGCLGGSLFVVVSDAGSVPPQSDDGSTGGTAACMPSDCANLGAPAIAKVCPDGTSEGATDCQLQSDGTCGWGFPPCPDAGSGDACITTPLPCPLCPNGSSSLSQDANGCYSCLACTPADDASVVCSCPNEPVPAICPDGSQQGTAEGPAPCHCPELLPCPGADAATDASSPANCQSDADCAQGYACGFPQSEGCSAQGTCFTLSAATCDAYLLGCACDGTALNLACTGLPSGYAHAPVHNMGACADGG